MRAKRFFRLSIILTFILSSLLRAVLSETRYSTKNTTNSRYDYASSYTLTTGTLSSGSLSDLQSSNNVYMVFASVNVSSVPTLDVKFNGTDSGSMPSIQCRIELKQSTTSGTEYFEGCNYTDGGYDNAGDMFTYGAFTTSDKNFYIYSASDMQKYRSAEAWSIRVLCNSSTASSFSVSLDFLYFRPFSYDLSTSQTAAYLSTSDISVYAYAGIRVFKTDTDYAETEITDGMVANVTIPDITTTLSNTWECIETEDVTTVRVRYYADGHLLTTGGTLASGGLPLVFETEDLEGKTLDAATWTCYYAFYFSAAAETTVLRFGHSTYNTRIEGFSTSTPSAQNIILTLIENLTLSTSFYSLKTKLLSSISTCSQQGTLTITKEKWLLQISSISLSLSTQTVKLKIFQNTFIIESSVYVFGLKELHFIIIIIVDSLNLQQAMQLIKEKIFQAMQSLNITSILTSSTQTTPIVSFLIITIIFFACLTGLSIYLLAKKYGQN